MSRCVNVDINKQDIKTSKCINWYNIRKEFSTDDELPAVVWGQHVVFRCRQVKNTLSECVFAFISCWHAAKQSVKQPKNSFVKKKKKKNLIM